MTEHRIGTQEEWQAERNELLKEEKELNRRVAQLKARDTTLLLASRAPLEKLLAYRERMGWGIDWVSSGSSDFNRELGFLHTEEELKPFLEGEIPLTVEQNARLCGTDVVGYVSEGPG